MKFNFCPSDISLSFVTRAYSGISFTPEKRAAQVQAEYVQHMQNLVESLSPLAVTPEQQAQLETLLEAYRQGYLKHLTAYLAAKSRVMSSMITGPSGFPVRQMEKRTETEHRRLGELITWSQRAQAAIKRQIHPTPPRSISADRPDAVVQLEAKIATAENLQARMVAANKIIRRKITDSDKIAQLIALGINESNACKLLKPDFAGRIGFADYMLKNNSAEIRRLKARVVDLSRIQAAPADGWTFSGGHVEINAEANRVQVFFDEKPDAAVRATLKHNGFHWSPNNSVWQRQRTEAAVDVTRRLFPPEK
jgi:hypothetical protein